MTRDRERGVVRPGSPLYQILGGLSIITAVTGVAVYHVGEEAEPIHTLSMEVSGLIILGFGVLLGTTALHSYLRR